MSTSRTILATSAALLAALALSGCGTTATGSAPESAPESSATEETADFNEADIMFAQMMIPHHRQAIEMSETLLAKDSASAETTNLAERIMAAQGPEIDQLNDMLESWGMEAMSDSDGMGGMDHSDGMMSEEDMTALEDATGEEAERLYLEQMIEHHEGAVEMAKPQIIDGQNADTIALAEDIIAAQEAEITEMKALLVGE